MTTSTEAVRGFYTAAQAGDGGAILALLHPDLRARTAPGMPSGAGGTFDGPETVLSRVWGAIFRDYDVAPYAETWQETTDGTIVVTGHYRGTARATGHPFEAEFAHLWQVTDGQISALHQYTDTAHWPDPQEREEVSPGTRSVRR